jgi:phospholipid/cholesterol/gamma-HCH transport system permease protein
MIAAISTFTHSISRSIGTSLFQLLSFVGGTTLLAKDILVMIRKRPLYLGLLIQQIYYTGYRSLSIVCATALSTGMVMSLQFGFGLERFGGKYYVPKILGLSLIRELAPVFTGLMLAGRVGAGITAEVGSMKVTQQIDAIRALGTSPIKKIVIPRVLACLIVLPLLTVIANAIGLIGGIYIGHSELGLDPVFFFQKFITVVVLNDFIVGVAKTVVFAAFIGLNGCYFGLTTSGGTQGVGIATTKSVVTSSILIVMSDVFLTKLFWIVERWTQ